MPPNKKGFAMIVVGGTGTGKTTFVKKIISKANKENILLYDVNNEYKLNNNPIPDVEAFTEQALRIRKGVIVFEEATIFFGSRGYNKELVNLLVKKRHNENFFIFCYHSLRSVPRYIFDLCNFLCLFKTNDNQTALEQKFESEAVTRAFDKVRRAKQYHFELVKLY